MTRPPAEDGQVPSTFRWCPVRSLSPRHRERIHAHLMALGDDDRRLRFGYAASDAHLSRYVDQIDFEHDEVFGVFNRRLDLVAMAHLAYLGSDVRRPTSAEFGVSALDRVRGRGIGARLFERAVLHARNRGIETMIIHALTENAPMMRIVRKAGATIEREGADSTAFLRLPREDLASHLHEMFENHAAAFDYGFKLHAKHFSDLMLAAQPTDDAPLPFALPVATPPTQRAGHLRGDTSTVDDGSHRTSGAPRTTGPQ